ncbi:MAG: HAMP domain-containing histidine kinase [Saprospiraceae bacterium]|nr:HAMP domain-containing histidine kinase [Saprospiraceae bacterium]
MRNWMIIILAGGALVGLIWVQYDLLKVGILLEKGRLDRTMKGVMEDIKERIDTSAILRKQISLKHRGEEKVLAGLEEEVQETLRDTIEDIVWEELRARKLIVEFEFALIDGFTLSTIVEKGSISLEDEAPYKLLGGKQLISDCRCLPYMHVWVVDWFAFLLQRLARVIIPSLLFMLVLIACMAWLFRMLKQQKKLDRVKNDFINNLTHELKTPVFSISLLLKLVRKGIADGNKKKIEEYLQLIEKENKQLKGHIDMVLELASLESGKFNLELRPAKIHALLQEVLSQFQPKLEDKKGRLRIASESIVTDLHIDQSHFQNMLNNLLENALKYNDKIPIIEINTRVEEQRYFIEVKDNGIGISTDDQKQIFDKFYRVSTGDLHRVKGFGLGLNYVKQVVEAHKGQITVKSKIGEGSTFTIELPIY